MLFMLPAPRSLSRLAAAFVILETVARAQVPVYTVTDVGPIYMQGVQFVAAINDNGHVTSTTPNRQAFGWDNGQTTLLPGLEPSNFSKYRHTAVAARLVDAERADDARD